METEATAKNILLIKHLKIRRHLISFSFLPFYFRVCDFSTISEPGTGLDCGDGPERYEQEKRGWGGVVWEWCGGAVASCHSLLSKRLEQAINN